MTTKPRILKNRTFRKRENGNGASQGPHSSPLGNYFENAANMMMGQGGVPKDVLATSEDKGEMVVRTYYKDSEEAMQSTEVLALRKELEMDPVFEERELLLLAANRAVGGNAMKEFLQAWSRVVVAEDVVYSAEVRSGKNGNRKKIKQLKDDDQDKDEEE